MKNYPLPIIVLYIIDIFFALLIGTLIRSRVVNMGFDGFTSFMFFILTIIFLFAITLSIHVCFLELIFPLVGKGLMKIPYFRKLAEKRRLSIAEREKSTTISEPVSLENIRNKQLQNKAKEQNEKLNVALEYTRKIFAPYVSDENIELLCNNVKIYADKLSLENLCSIKINKDLTTIDVYHFGWNIWNHFQISDQMQMAKFLKIVFTHTLREVEDIETIKKKLKIFESKCEIQIKENLSE